jgi:hypothetical protein
MRWQFRLHRLLVHCAVNDRAEAFRAADLRPRLEGLSEKPASNSQGAARSCENAAQHTASESERANYEKNHCEPKRALKHALRSSENSIFEYWTASRFLQPSFARGSLRASVSRCVRRGDEIRVPQGLPARCRARAQRNAFHGLLKVIVVSQKVTMPPDAPLVRRQNWKLPATVALQYF